MTEVLKRGQYVFTARSTSGATNTYSATVNDPENVDFQVHIHRESVMGKMKPHVQYRTITSNPLKRKLAKQLKAYVQGGQHDKFVYERTNGRSKPIIASPTKKPEELIGHPIPAYRPEQNDPDHIKKVMEKQQEMQLPAPEPTLKNRDDETVMAALKAAWSIATENMDLNPYKNDPGKTILEGIRIMKRRMK